MKILFVEDDIKLGRAIKELPELEDRTVDCPRMKTRLKLWFLTMALA